MHHLDNWAKRDQLDVTCFIISLYNAQHVSDVNTSETCWALYKEIIKQVTSSWSLFTQLFNTSVLQPSMKHLYTAVQGWLTQWRFKIFWLRYLEEKYLEDGSRKLPGTSVTVYQLTQYHIPKDLNLHQCSYKNLVSHTIIQPYQLAKTVCTCLPLQMTNLMTGTNITLCRRRNLYGQRKFFVASWLYVQMS